MSRKRKTLQCSESGSNLLSATWTDTQFSASSDSCASSSQMSSTEMPDALPRSVTAQHINSISQVWLLCQLVYCTWRLACDKWLKINTQPLPQNDWYFILFSSSWVKNYIRLINSMENQPSNGMWISLWFFFVFFKYMCLQKCVNDSISQNVSNCRVMFQSFPSSSPPWCSSNNYLMCVANVRKMPSSVKTCLLSEGRARVELTKSMIAFMLTFCSLIPVPSCIVGSVCACVFMCCPPDEPYWLFAF